MRKADIVTDRWSYMGGVIAKATAKDYTFVQVAD
jgi:hypothetical protein